MLSPTWNFETCLDSYGTSLTEWLGMAQKFSKLRHFLFAAYIKIDLVSYRTEQNNQQIIYNTFKNILRWITQKRTFTYSQVHITSGSSSENARLFNEIRASSFLYGQYFAVHANTKALVRLCTCTVSPEVWLFAYAMRSLYEWCYSFHWFTIQS